MPNTALLTAAILTFAIGAAHSWLGEGWLLGPLLDPETRQGLLEKSTFARRVLRFAWHLTTIAWWGFAAVLILLARAPIDASGRAALAGIAGTFLATGLVTCLSSRGRHFAWPIFVTIAGLSIVPLLS